jgi:hypothetical protein
MQENEWAEDDDTDGEDWAKIGADALRAGCQGCGVPTLTAAGEGHLTGKVAEGLNIARAAK